MDRRTLGRTGWAVSEIACGTYRSFDQSGRGGQGRVDGLVRANLELGVNLFDAAPMYGHAEQTLGAALNGIAPGQTLESGGPIVATKVLQPDRAGAAKQIERSFALLGRIDLLQIHNMAGWRTVLPYLAELKAEGRIRATGLTHYDPGSFGEIEAACKTGQADAIQIPLNIIERQAEQRLLPLARDLNLGVLVMTPMQPIFRRSELLGRLRKLDLAPYGQHGVSDPGSLCLKYLLSKHPDVVLLPATSRLERAASNAAVSGTPPLDADAVAHLERLVGG